MSTKRQSLDFQLGKKQFFLPLSENASSFFSHAELVLGGKHKEGKEVAEVEFW